MTNIIKLATYLNRQKEIFDAYIGSSGKEIAVLDYLEKYEQEDNTQYKPVDLLKYLNSYIKSNRITEEELNAYEETRLVSNDIVFKRGRIIVDAIIESLGSTDFLDNYGSMFAKKDGKLTPYDKTYLLKCRDYYLSHSKNYEIIIAYNNVLDLTANGNYDIELPIRILEISNNEVAINFINRINISKSSLRRLIAEYETLYPANTANITRLNYLLKEAYKNDLPKSKFITSKPQERMQDRLVNLRHILEEYLISDIEDIKELFPKYKFNEYKFNETIKDALTSRDIIIHNLINKYQAKSLSIANSYKKIIEAIMQAHDYGINYGYGYREFNVFDFYNLKDNVLNDTLLKYANIIYEQSDYERIKQVIEENTLVNVCADASELAYLVGPNCDEIIIDYLRYANLPLAKEMYDAVATRLQEKDITFEVVDAVVNK